MKKFLILLLVFKGLLMAQEAATIHLESRKVSFYKPVKENNIVKKGDLINYTMEAYDKTGNLVSSTKYAATGEVMSKYINTYDTKGQCIRYESYNDKSMMDFKIEMKYDAKGNKTEEYIYSLNEESELVLSETTTYTYENGNKVEEISKEKDKSEPNKTTYKYDSKGNRTEIVTYYKDQVVSKDTYKFNDQSRVTEQISYNENGSVFSTSKFSYELDKAGNVSKETIELTFGTDPEKTYYYKEATYDQYNYETRIIHFTGDKATRLIELENQYLK